MGRAIFRLEAVVTNGGWDAMPHVPNFPSPDESEDEEQPSGSIIDRIIDDGAWPSAAGR